VILESDVNIALSYPLYVNVWNKETMDVHRATTVGIEPLSDKQLQLEAQVVHDEHPVAAEVK
jgi:hypothetical protein